jgi:hypothetical protein
LPPDYDCIIADSSLERQEKSGLTVISDWY